MATSLKVEGGITIGGGISAGPDVTVGPAPGGTTYTEGVDYANGGVILSGVQSIIVIVDANWNTSGWTNIINKPPGTTFTFTFASAPPGIATITGAWNLGGNPQASISTTYSLGVMDTPVTITFSN